MQNEDDLYGDSQAAPESPGGKPSDDAGEDEGDQKTFVVPEEVCPGMKPGDMMRARVLRVNEGSYEMAYEPEEKSEEEEPTKAPAEVPAPDSMASMME